MGFWLVSLGKRLLLCQMALLQLASHIDCEGGQ